MYDDAMLEQIRFYLRQNQSRYTIDALRARLVADGAPADAVERCIAELNASPYYGPAPGVAPTEPGQKWGVGKFFLVLALGVLVNVGVVAAATFASFALETGWAFGGVCLLAAAAEVYVAIVYAKKNSAVTAGLLVAIAVTPVIVVLLLIGVCFAAIYSMNGRIAG